MRTTLFVSSFLCAALVERRVQFGHLTPVETGVEEAIDAFVHLRIPLHHFVIRIRKQLQFIIRK